MQQQTLQFTQCLCSHGQKTQSVSFKFLCAEECNILVPSCAYGVFVSDIANYNAHLPRKHCFKKQHVLFSQSFISKAAQEKRTVFELFGTKNNETDF